MTNEAHNQIHHIDRIAMGKRLHIASFRGTDAEAAIFAKRLQAAQCDGEYVERNTDDVHLTDRSTMDQIKAAKEIAAQFKFGTKEYAAATRAVVALVKAAHESCTYEYEMFSLYGKGWN